MQIMVLGYLCAFFILCAEFHSKGHGRNPTTDLNEKESIMKRTTKMKLFRGISLMLCIIMLMLNT